MRLRPSLLLVSLIGSLLLVPSTSGLAAPVAPVATERATRHLPVGVLSNRRDLISGGDALVEVRLPSGVRARQVTVLLNGDPVTRRFHSTDDGRLLGLVCGSAPTGSAPPHPGTPERRGS